MKNSPFQTARKRLEIVSVGDPETGVIYLAKRGGITPNENPVDMQESMQRQTKATLIFLQAVKNCADKEGISRAEARERIFPSPQAQLPESVTSSAESSALAERGGAIVIAPKKESADLYDYLEPSQAVELIALQEDSRNVALQSATLFIQHRLAYPIVITTDAKAKSNLLEVKPLTFQIAAGNRFRIGDAIVEATEEASYDSEMIVIKPLDQSISSGAVGYLLDVTGREKLGDPDWRHEHTRAYLTEAQVEAIYRFYQAEIGMAPETTSEPTEGNLTMTSPDSQSSSTESRSTGAKSTGKSKATVSETNDSTVKILEVSPIG